MTFQGIKNFKQREFTCKCGCGQTNMNMEFVRLLDKLRDMVGFPISVMSGYRCLKHNRAVGSMDTSAHVTGDAVDIVCRASGTRFRIIEAAIKLGVNRIGVAPNFIHLDISKKNPPNVMWLY